MPFSSRAGPGVSFNFFLVLSCLSFVSAAHFIPVVNERVATIGISRDAPGNIQHPSLSRRTDEAAHAVPVGIIVGSVMGGVIGLVALALTFWILHRYKVDKARDLEEEKSAAPQYLPRTPYADVMWQSIFGPSNDGRKTPGITAPSSDVGSSRPPSSVSYGWKNIDDNQPSLPSLPVQPRFTLSASPLPAWSGSASHRTSLDRQLSASVYNDDGYSTYARDSFIYSPATAPPVPPIPGGYNSPASPGQGVKPPEPAALRRAKLEQEVEVLQLELSVLEQELQTKSEETLGRAGVEIMILREKIQITTVQIALLQSNRSSS